LARSRSYGLDFKWYVVLKKEVAILVHAVMSTGLVTAKKTDTVRSAMMNMLNRHCGALPVVEGEVRLIGRITFARGLAAAFKGVGRIVSPVQKQIYLRPNYLSSKGKARSVLIEALA